MHFRDWLNYAAAQRGMPTIRTDGSVQVQEDNFAGLLRAGGLKAKERTRLLVSVHDNSTLDHPITVESEVKPLLPRFWGEKVLRDRIDIQANPGLISSRENDIDNTLSDGVAALGHRIKHRRIRSYLGGFLTLSAVSGSARLVFLELKVPVPEYLTFTTPQLPIIGTQHVAATALFTLMAVGWGSAAAAQVLIREPRHEKQFEKKKIELRAYAHRTRPFLKA